MDSLRQLCRRMTYLLFSSLVLGTEELDLLLDFSADSFVAGKQKLTRIVTLTLLVLAFFDVLTSCGSEYQLALGVYIDLGYTKGDRKSVV